MNLITKYKRYIHILKKIILITCLACVVMDTHAIAVFSNECCGVTVRY